QYMYTVTCLLLNLSFVYRLDAETSNKWIDYVRVAVILIIVGILVLNAPIFALYHHVEMRKDPILDDYRLVKGVGQDIAIGIVQYTDLFSMLAVNYSMLTSFIPFIASVIMRRKIIHKMHEMTGKLSIATQHDMLIKALNLQLIVSSCSLLGAALFTFNLIILNLVPDFPETNAVVVTICNMQGVISAFSNLYIITPYR
ncbi:hypothetical protein PENTCL1PPCAC_12794, partial [Pristionchus entomophagus]